MRRQCKGTNRDGAPCGSNPRKGQDYCWRHPAADSSEGSGAHTGATVRETWDREAWLAAYEASKMVTAACRAIGISPSTAYLERERNEAFAADWDQVRAHVVRPSLEDEAFRRAVEGVEKRVVSAGQDLGTETVYSDQLLVVLLKANLPEKYRERMDVAHSGGVVQVKGRVDLSKLTDEQLDALDAIENALKGGEPGV